MEEIDVEKLKASYQHISAELRCNEIITQMLRSENDHLRKIIEILITKQIS